VGRVIDVTVPPFNGQIFLTAREDLEPPDLGGGDEAASRNPVAIAIDTVEDIDARGHPEAVDVEVWAGDEPLANGWSLRVDGSFWVTRWGIAVEDVLNDEVYRADISPGVYKCRVYGRPIGLPKAVRFVLTRN
jgi:hypothetical protein